MLIQRRLNRQEASLISRERNREAMKIWRNNNKEHYRDYQRRYEKNRVETDPQYKIMKSLRGCLSSLIRRNIIRGVPLKKNKTLFIMGCTLSEFKQHIECRFRDGMSWENYGPFWELDHIKPNSQFDLTDEAQLKMAWNYTNFQPLLKIENRLKYKYLT